MQTTLSSVFNKPDAERFREELGKRLGKFGLEVEPTKTKIMEFGRFAVPNAKRRGGRAKTFDFLGFTHYCGTNRDGKGFRMKRVTVRKKFIAKLKMFNFSSTVEPIFAGRSQQPIDFTGSFFAMPK